MDNLATFMYFFSLLNDFFNLFDVNYVQVYNTHYNLHLYIYVCFTALYTTQAKIINFANTFHYLAKFIF